MRTASRSVLHSRPAAAPLHAAVPRPPRRQLRRPARASSRSRPTTTTGGWTASSAPARPAGTRSIPKDCIATLPLDMMGYHDQREIPNYWTYARQFVLQDHMFEPNASWSLPAHLFLVSEWSALCVTSRRSVQLHVEHRGPGPADRHRAAPLGSRLRLDRPHLPVRPPPRQLGLLHQEGARAGLRERAGVLPVPGSGRPDTRDLEPAAELRHGPRGPPARQHPGHEQVLRGRCAAGSCRPSRG